MRPGAAETAESMVGNRYGQLTVLSVSGCKEYHYSDRVVNRPVLRVRCDCGNEFEIVYSNLKKQHPTTRCCECALRDRVASNETDLTGQTFGQLTVLGREGDWQGVTKTLWRVRCNRCGNITTIDGAHLGHTLTCCASKDTLAEGAAKNRAGHIDGTYIYALGDRAQNRNNTSGYTGVSSVITRGKQRYRAYINFRRKQYSLGFFDTPEDAHEAYLEAKQRIHGEFLDWYYLRHPEAIPVKRKQPDED